MPKFYTPSGQEIDAKYIKRLFDEVKQWRTPFYNRWVNYYKQYRGYREASDYPFRSNLFIPYTFSLVEHIVPSMLSTIFSTEPIVTVVPRKGAVSELASLLETILNYFLEDNRLKLYYKLYDFFKEAVIYGTSFARILPVFSTENFYNELTNETGPKLDYINVEPIDLFRVYPDWRATSLEDMRFIIIEHEKTEDELRELERMGFIPKGIVDELSTTAVIDEARTKRQTSAGLPVSSAASSSTKFYKVYEYWDKRCVVWISGEFILKEVENLLGRLPFIMMQFTKVPNELYGIGIPEMIADLQEELNTIRNQRIDNINLIINRMFVVNKYADIDMDSLVSYAGNVILTNDVDAIKPLTTPDVTRSSYLEEEIIVRDIDMTTGLYSQLRGIPPAQRQPATTVVRLQQAALARFDSLMKMFEYGVIRELSSIFLFYIRKFLPPEKFMEIVGPQEFVERNGFLFYSMPFEDIVKNYHFRPVGSAMTGIRELRTQQLLQAFAMFSKLPFVNLYEFAKLILREGFGIKNINQLLLPLQSVGQAGQPPLEAQPEGSTLQPTLPGQALTPVEMEALAEEGRSGNEGVNIEGLLRGLAGIITRGREEGK